MALLLTPAPGTTFFTTHRLPVPALYVVVSCIEYHKYASEPAVIRYLYFTSAEAARAKPQAEPLPVLGLPTELVVLNPLELLANPARKSASTIAYELAFADLARALGDTGTVTTC